MSGTGDDRDIEARLRRYIAAHPHAADTPRGIVSFWLGLAPTPAAIAATERALGRLEREGLMRARALGPEVFIWFVCGG